MFVVWSYIANDSDHFCIKTILPGKIISSDILRTSLWVGTIYTSIIIHLSVSDWIPWLKLEQHKAKWETNMSFIVWQWSWATIRQKAKRTTSIGINVWNTAWQQRTVEYWLYSTTSATNAIPEPACSSDEKVTSFQGFFWWSFKQHVHALLNLQHSCEHTRILMNYLFM